MALYSFQIYNDNNVTVSKLFLFGRLTFSAPCHVVAKRLSNKFFAVSDLVKDGLMKTPEWMFPRIVEGFMTGPGNSWRR